MSLQPGSRLGVYEILGLLGAGGMGEVYRARDRKLGREIAIKVLPEEFARDPSRVSRFEREARMLAAVNHPTIAAIYGAEEDGSTRYIVMELVEGETLAERLSGGALPVADALRIGAGIVEALEVAHEKGVIHRDLKPANIKLNREGKVKVLDFGLAKAMDLPFAGDMSRTPTLVMDDSRPGDIVGTPEFMSPEQARGKETDRRTDIWAFGCILFEMLSGKRAFTGETIPDALLAILDREPDWSALPARTPPRVRELLARCLEKDPARRLRDAGDARLELDAAIVGLSGGGRPAPCEPAAEMERRAGGGGRRPRAIAAAGYLICERQARRMPTPGRQLAVLPFRNLTGVPDGELWGLGHGRDGERPARRRAGPAGRDARGRPSKPPTKIRTSCVSRRTSAPTRFSRGRSSARRNASASRIASSTRRGISSRRRAIDGSELFDSPGPRRRRRRERPSVAPWSASDADPSGLDTPAQQELYLQAIGLLQRYDRTEGVENAVGVLRGLAGRIPTRALVQAALGRASLAMFDFTKDPKWADHGHGRQRTRRTRTRSGPARSRRHARRDSAP